MKKLFLHPVTQKTRTVIRRVVIVCAVILAATLVTTVTVDLGPAVKARVEAAATQYLRRPMHIGRMSVHLLRGRFVLDDLVIEGLTPDSRPFLTAQRMTVSMPWSTLVDQRVVFDAIEMTDWRMYVETFPDGRHNVPRLRGDPPQERSAWTTTLQYVRAHRGEFTFTDHGTPWNVVTRNLDVIVTRPTSEYRGQARFSDGTVTIQDYVPMRADMSTTFRIIDGTVVLDRIDLLTDGARSELTGRVDFTRWPEQVYEVQSRLDFSRMREIFFADDDFTLSGEGDFTGTFHLFPEVVNGRSRTGRELKGTFSSAEVGVNAYRFGDLRGSVLWVPERLEVSDATARVYGGAARFGYRMAPLGQPGVRATARFDADYENVDLVEFTNVLELQGIRLAGRAAGRSLLEWPLGRFAALHGDGEVRVEPPARVRTQTRRLPSPLPAASVPAAPPGPFSNHTPREPVPISAALAYVLDPEWVELRPSRVATPSTYVEFEGRTAYGERSRIPFHVTSADWQDSDRVFAGILTALGSRTNAIPIGGDGTFDGVLLNAVRRPRIEGTFAGGRVRAFDVVWGSVAGKAVIEDNYADVSDIVVRADDSVMHVDGRFTLGFPRRDGGEEINARIRVTGRPLADLRHAFELDEYDVDGVFSGEFRVLGNYLTPFGFGQMSIVDGVAYGEPFETAAAALRLEGSGVRIDSIQIANTGGRATGAAYVGFNGTYSFNLDGRRIPVEQVALASSGTAPPLSGLFDFTAGGSGTFDEPRYDVRGTISDLFVGDEGIGQVLGQLSVNGDLMTVKVEAASPRLAVSGSGRIALTPGMEAELLFSVADTSLDPYVRVFSPLLSPYTTAIASGASA